MELLKELLFPVELVIGLVNDPLALVEVKPVLPTEPEVETG
jgi:hypothetical protein